MGCPALVAIPSVTSPPLLTEIRTVTKDETKAAATDSVAADLVAPDAAAADAPVAPDTDVPVGVLF